MVGKRTDWVWNTSWSFFLQTPLKRTRSSHLCQYIFSFHTLTLCIFHFSSVSSTPSLSLFTSDLEGDSSCSGGLVPTPSPSFSSSDGPISLPPPSCRRARAGAGHTGNLGFAAAVLSLSDQSRRRKRMGVFRQSWIHLASVYFGISYGP